MFKTSGYLLSICYLLEPAAHRRGKLKGSAVRELAPEPSASDSTKLAKVEPINQQG